MGGPKRFRHAISTMPNGSGDTTYNYVEVFTLAIVSLLAGIVWTVISHTKRHDACGTCSASTSGMCWHSRC